MVLLRAVRLSNTQLETSRRFFQNFKDTGALPGLEGTLLVGDVLYICPHMLMKENL